MEDRLNTYNTAVSGFSEYKKYISVFICLCVHVKRVLRIGGREDLSLGGEREGSSIINVKMNTLHSLT